MNIINNTEWLAKAQELFKIQEMKNYYTKLEEQVKIQLKTLSGEESCAGGDFIFEKTFRNGSVDYSSIPVLRTIDLEQYRKEPVAYWKLYKKLIKPEE